MWWQVIALVAFVLDRLSTQASVAVLQDRGTDRVYHSDDTEARKSSSGISPWNWEAPLLSEIVVTAEIPEWVGFSLTLGIGWFCDWKPASGGLLTSEATLAAYFQNSR